jgi:hypothetical protein
MAVALGFRQARGDRERPLLVAAKPSIITH